MVVIEAEMKPYGVEGSDGVEQGNQYSLKQVLPLTTTSVDTDLGKKDKKKEET